MSEHPANIPLDTKTEELVGVGDNCVESYELDDLSKSRFNRRTAQGSLDEWLCQWFNAHKGLPLRQTYIVSGECCAENIGRKLHELFNNISHQCVTNAWEIPKLYPYFRRASDELFIEESSPDFWKTGRLGRNKVANLIAKYVDSLPSPDSDRSTDPYAVNRLKRDVEMYSEQVSTLYKSKEKKYKVKHIKLFSWLYI